MMQYSVKNLYQKEIGSSESFRLDENLADFELTEAVIGHSLKGDLKAIRLEDSVVVAGELAAEVNLICDRCLCNFDKKIGFSFEREFFFDRKDMLPENLYADKYLNIDLTESLREEILLNIDTKNICKVDCKGICPNCGVDLNTEACLCEKPKEA
jgi:uncharacterized protein